MIFDPNYILFVVLPALVLSLIAQFFVRAAYSKWGNVQNGSNLTGAQVAERIMQRTDVHGVGLQGTPGELTDHYDPRDHTVHLSQKVAQVPSVASMAIVAHELGHAQQHQERSLLIQMRNFLVPAVQLTPTVGYIMIILGLVLRFSGLFWLGILAFGVMVIFMILTLPVEIDASMRGLRLLRQSDLIAVEQDASGAQQVLTAAALTYVAAAVQAVLQLLYFISLGSRRS